MEVRITLEVLDNEEVLYEKTKRSNFDPEPFYDRMLFTQLTELLRSHKDDIKLEDWFISLKNKRSK